MPDHPPTPRELEMLQRISRLEDSLFDLMDLILGSGMATLGLQPIPPKLEAEYGQLRVAVEARWKGARD